MLDQPGLGEQALNKAAEMGLSSQLDEVEHLDVHIKTDPFQLIQGHIDSVTIKGEGMVMQKDLRVEEMDIEMDSVSINTFTAAFGKIELTKPTDASAHVILTEADLNRAFNSEFVRSKLHNLQVNVDGQPTTIDAKHVDFSLPGEGKVALNATVLLHQIEEKQVAFTAVPHVNADGKTVTLEDVHYGEGKELSPELTKALVNQTSELLNLSNFDLEGMSLRIKSLDVEVGKITFQAEAHVDHMPSG